MTDMNMRIMTSNVKVQKNHAFANGTLEIVDININDIQGVLIQNNSFGKFVEVYNKDGKAIFKSEMKD